MDVWALCEQEWEEAPISAPAGIYATRAHAEAAAQLLQDDISRANRFQRYVLPPLTPQDRSPFVDGCVEAWRTDRYWLLRYQVEGI